MTGTSDRADELVGSWLLVQVRRSFVPGSAAYLHYRDCPRLIVEWDSSQVAYSEVTTEEYARFDVRWGCAHGPERLSTTIHSQYTLPEIIGQLDSEDLKAQHAMQYRIAASPGAFCRGYPAGGEGGRVYDPADCG